jgi:hypothetical protein
LSALLFLAVYFAARAILEQDLADNGLRIVAALAPAAPFAWMLWEIIGGIRVMDELEQRIQLEALAVAFPLTLVLLMILGLLELAITLPAEDLGYRHVWAMLPALYFLGLFLARKRYR